MPVIFNLGKSQFDRESYTPTFEPGRNASVNERGDRAAYILFPSLAELIGAGVWFSGWKSLNHETNHLSSFRVYSCDFVVSGWKLFTRNDTKYTKLRESKDALTRNTEKLEDLAHLAFYCDKSNSYSLLVALDACSGLRISPERRRDDSV